jgi:la-related protein 1
LKFSQLNENLFIKAIKVDEKLGDYDSVRKLVSSVESIPLDRSWRMMLEGALFEGRIGNQAEARKIFKKLLQSCKSYGPVYFEASKYEEREGNIEESLVLCEEGLDYNVKYSPLWFQYLRLYEKYNEKDRVARFGSLQTILNEMFQNITRELEWKIYIEAA